MDVHDRSPWGGGSDRETFDVARSGQTISAEIRAPHEMETRLADQLRLAEIEPGVARRNPSRGLVGLIWDASRKPHVRAQLGAKGVPQLNQGSSVVVAVRGGSCRQGGEPHLRGGAE
jgi:hypothetical protein